MRGWVQPPTWRKYPTVSGSSGDCWNLNILNVSGAEKVLTCPEAETKNIWTLFSSLNISLAFCGSYWKSVFCSSEMALFTSEERLLYGLFIFCDSVILILQSSRFTK